MFKVIKKFAALTMLLGVIVFIYITFTNPWSKINCWTNEIDINTGQKRYTRFIAFFPTKREVTDTWVSMSLEEKHDTRAWRKTSTLTPYTSHSPHYSFHSALADLASFSPIIEEDLIEKGAVSLVAQNVLKLWKENNSDHAAGLFLNDIARHSYNKSDTKGHLSKEDIKLLIENSSE